MAYCTERYETVETVVKKQEFAGYTLEVSEKELAYLRALLGNTVGVMGNDLYGAICKTFPSTRPPDYTARTFGASGTAFIVRDENGRTL